MAQKGRCVSQDLGIAADVKIDLIGEDPLFQRMLDTAEAVAANNCVVLLEGESGTGKELIAKRIHNSSARREGPFIPVNCPAVAESLFESQFYGHVKGSFTGAHGDTLGMVRAAQGGTLFLDEIGELPLHLQPKLLRLLQEKEVTPVGGTKAITVDVRFVAATNRSLAKAVQMGQFRRDLYHRLNIVRIAVPPLRTRPGDIALLLDHYLEYYAAEYHMEVRQFDAEVYASLLRYTWPGNVRELCAWVERLYAANIPAVAPGGEMWEDQYATGGVQPVLAEDIVSALERPGPASLAPAGASMGAPALAAAAPSGLIASLAQTEAEAIRQALSLSRDNRSAAAKLLNIHRTTLLRKMKLYDIA
jgi:transcriptional regulator with PAS, ATPase and Fis domain